LLRSAGSGLRWRQKKVLVPEGFPVLARVNAMLPGCHCLGAWSDVFGVPPLSDVPTAQPTVTGSAGSSQA